MNSAYAVGSDFNLRDFAESDVNETYLGWLNDEHLMQFSNQRFIKHDVASSYEYLASMRRAGNLFLAIVQSESKRLVGTVAAELSRYHGTANLGILIGDPAVRGMGLGKRVWLASMTYLFTEQDVRKVCAGTLESNIPMNRIAVATDMRLEGVLAAQELINDSPVNMNLYGKLRI